MSNLSIFNFADQEIRVAGTPDRPLWVSKDVCDVLEVKNSRDALKRLDDDEKGVVLTDTPGGNQEVTVLTESGLYSLVLSSRKPQAKAFKKWITSEVIPAIRKKGSYGIQPAAPVNSELDQFLANLERAKTLGLDITAPELQARLLQLMGAAPAPSLPPAEKDPTVGVFPAYRLRPTETRCDMAIVSQIANLGLGKGYNYDHSSLGIYVSKRVKEVNAQVPESLQIRSRKEMTNYDSFSSPTWRYEDCPGMELIIAEWFDLQAKPPKVIQGSVLEIAA